MIEANIIHEALQVASRSCYFWAPLASTQNTHRSRSEGSSPLSGPLEPTNRAYAGEDRRHRAMSSSTDTSMAAISFLPCQQICMDRVTISVLESSHVLAALILQIHSAKRKREHSITIWGSGEPRRREFLHVDDCADALVHSNEKLFRAGSI